MTLLLTTPGTLTEIVRLREAPGAYDDTGRWQPGAVTETTLLASVQPLVLEGADLAGGVSLIERVKVYAPSVEYVAAHGDRLMWGSAVLQWGADVVRWSSVGGLTDVDGPVLVAAFDNSEADRVRLGGDDRMFVVESTMAWPSHTEAVLLRQT